MRWRMFRSCASSIGCCDHRHFQKNSDSTFLYYPCDKLVYCNRVPQFFPVNNFVHRIHLIWISGLISSGAFFQNKFNYKRRYQHPSEGTNRTLPGPVFFSKMKYSVSNKIVGQLFVCLCFVGLVTTSLNRFS